MVAHCDLDINGCNIFIRKKINSFSATWYVNTKLTNASFSKGGSKAVHFKLMLDRIIIPWIQQDHIFLLIIMWLDSAPCTKSVSLPLTLGLTMWHALNQQNMRRFDICHKWAEAYNSKFPLCLNPILSYPRKEILLEPGSHNEKTHTTQPQSSCVIQAKLSLSHGKYLVYELKLFMCIEEKVSKAYTKLLKVLIKSMYTVIFTFQFVHFRTVWIF